VVLHHCVFIKPDVCAKTSEQSAKFLQFFFPSAGALSHQDPYVHATFHSIGEFIEDGEIVAPENGEKQSALSGSHESYDRGAPLSRSEYKTIHSLTDSTIHIRVHVRKLAIDFLHVQSQPSPCSSQPRPAAHSLRSFEAT
jgi:hypothetical protein